MKIQRLFRDIYIYFKRNDNIIMILTLAAAAIGYALVYSASYNMPSASRLVMVQAIAIAAGFICMIFLSVIDYHMIAQLWKFIAAGAILLLIATILFAQGRGTVQETNWIHLPGGISIQPSEIVKIAFIITLSKHIDLVKNEINKPINIGLLLLHFSVPIAFLLKQTDFGMILVFTVIFFGMLFAANVQLRYFAGAAILTLIAAPLLWMNMGSRQTKRILALFDPYTYHDYVFQQLQSVSAIGSGKVWGYGLLHGPKTQAYWKSGALPAKQTDMIFAVTGEELGFVGCMLVIIVLFALLVKILMAARNAKDMLGSMMCVGIFMCFAIQIVANIGMCLFVMPVIGLTLPFMSSGGTSVLSSFIAIGLVLSVSKRDVNLLFS